MRPKTVRALRYKIRTVGYCHRRMRYFHTKAVILERLVASKNLHIDYSESLEKMLRYQKKADWYRKRDDDLLPIEDQEQVVELDLTESRLNAIAINFYEASDAVLSKRYAADFIESLFNVSIPDEWK